MTRLSWRMRRKVWMSSMIPLAVSHHTTRGAAIIIRRQGRALHVRRGTHVYAAGRQGGGVPEELRERGARGAAQTPAAPRGLLLQRDRPAEHDRPPLGLGQPRRARQVPRQDAGGSGL